MTDFKQSLDLIKILMKFISKSTESQQRDVASHILVLLIDAYSSKCEDDAKTFLQTVTHSCADNFPNQKNPLFSLPALSFALFTLMKTNKLAKNFCNALGFKIMDQLLEGPCIENAQIAYNVIGTLWVLSYHERSHSYFQDYRLAIIEKVSKVLDFFSWEKIVRIMLMLFDNLKTNTICQEHLSDIDALSLIIKL